jgi:hypothetical protein
VPKVHNAEVHDKCQLIQQCCTASFSSLVGMITDLSQEKPIAGLAASETVHLLQ